jgi:methionyl-tRNA formyltransferase
MNESTTQKPGIKILFFGTSEFAIPTLEALVREGYEIAAVITNPDEPVGRKKVLTPPPVKIAAQNLGLDILQFSSLKTESLKLKIPDADVGIVASYGKIIPAEIINLPRHGTINIHPSLLPKYRGPTPIQSTILNGEKETGITIIKIDEEVDHGQILTASQWPITDGGTYKELEGKLAKSGAELLIKILPDYLADRIELQPQDHLQATFTKKFTRDDAKIDWNKTAEEIDCQIRALNPEPGTWTMWNGKILKILEVEITDRESRQSGQVFQKDDKAAVGTAKGLIVLKTVQPEGKKPMSVRDLIRGNPDFIGSILE